MCVSITFGSEFDIKKSSVVLPDLGDNYHLVFAWNWIPEHNSTGVDPGS